jgi:chorismate mutase
MSIRYLLLFCFCAFSLFSQQSTDLAQALEPSRQRINSIDDQIVKLLNERAQAVREVGSSRSSSTRPRAPLGGRSRCCAASPVKPARR